MAKWYTPNWELAKKLPKYAAIAGGVAAVAALTPVAVSALRNRRRADDDMLPPPPELTAPLPQLVTPEQMMMAQQQQMMQMQAAQGQDTLMGMPKQEGRWVQTTRGGEMGMSAAPNITGPDGTNMIDGSKGVQELNAPMSPSR